jgi:hypothetical protein
MKAYLAATAILLAGCGSNTTPAATVTVTPSTTEAPAQAMSDWKQSAANEIHAMGDSLIAVGDAMQGPDLPAMRVGCTRLSTSVDHLERDLPSPDQQVNSALQDTIDDFRSLSQLCMTLNSTAEIAEMQRLVDRGSQRMTHAFDLMGAS